MSQQKLLLYLIPYLLQENPQYSEIKIPHSEKGQKQLFRSLMNIRPPRPIAAEFLEKQDQYLSEELRKKNITPLTELSSCEKGIYLWQGDITTLAADAIVNAANNAMLGCFIPCHGCIDNAIHSAAGIQLRLECSRIMEHQGREEATGAAKITKAYNLPCRFVLHTVGPIVQDIPTDRDIALLASCYRSCLELAVLHKIQSIAFCCISTGEFHFPNDLAAQIAIDTVRTYLKQHQNKMEVIFNVFKDTDYELYERLLRGNQSVIKTTF